MVNCVQVLLKDGDYFCFDDIIVKIKELPNPERFLLMLTLMSRVFSLVMLMLCLCASENQPAEQ